jgi:hypothetical protein
MMAAVVCSMYEVNGYDDWFLPSADELDLIYQNLAKFGWGGFRAWVYLSSTSPGWSDNAIREKTVRAAAFDNGGKGGNVPQTSRWYVRPIRSF